MSYDLIEVSTEDGRPVELYEFQRGGVYWRYTSGDADIIYSAETYQAVAIERSSITQTERFSESGITIEFARTEAFANTFLAYSPDTPTILTIYRTHYEDGEFIVYWKGKVSAATADGARIKLECDSVFSALKRQGLRQRYERMCRHVLYDTNCQLNKDDFKFEATVSAVTGNNITFTLTIPDSEKLVDYFLGGMIQDALGVYRFITAQSSNVITISYPFELIAVSDVVNIYAGCQHRANADCLAKFNNLNNYGGVPYYPTDDGPFTGRSIA